MKKFFTYIGIIFLALGLISCREKSPSSSANKKITLLATIFPAYDWAKNLTAGSDNVSVELLLKEGVDLHSYQPSAKDIVKISTADIFIYVGGESDKWVDDALKNATNKDMLVINLMEALKGFVKQEELVEGMEDSHSHEEGHAHEEGENHNHEDEHHHEEDEHTHEEEGLHLPQLASRTHDEIEYDEHVWLSLNNAIASSNEIAKALMEKDEANS
ncbi:MAG: zinc ABC transporter substrate-binding protein, partial [Treponema sp.]|nr:zinc ABC transporter substrate-binding protein [Treponema sp.]